MIEWDLVVITLYHETCKNTYRIICHYATCNTKALLSDKRKRNSESKNFCPYLTNYFGIFQLKVWHLNKNAILSIRYWKLITEGFMNHPLIWFLSILFLICENEKNLCPAGWKDTLPPLQQLVCYKYMCKTFNKIRHLDRWVCHFHSKISWNNADWAM